MNINLTEQNSLPVDGTTGTLIGRVWVPGVGPAVVALQEDQAVGITESCVTVSQLLNESNPVAAVKRYAKFAEPICTVSELLANSSVDTRDENKPYLLSPIDLQAIKAAGVTFVASMLERVIEEKAKGSPEQALAIRETINQEIGSDLSGIVPGSESALKLKQALIKRDMWSQYLEVGIGPFAEVFSKSQPMSSVGSGVEVGIHDQSVWNNPEPEVVLAVNAKGEIVGATLGNDVNLRDFEGRSALLLGKAKDNNSSCSIGPFIRLFDDSFGIDDVRQMEVTLDIHGDDGFELNASSNMAKISRDPTDLVNQTLNKNHQYPEGLVLFTGTMFAPTQDRDEQGLGFTHHLGDVVAISTPKLGSLINKVNHSSKIAPWTFGTSALMNNLAKRGLLRSF